LGGSLPLLIAKHEPSLNEFLKQLLHLLREYENLKSSSGDVTRNKISGVGRKLFRSRKSDAGLEPVKSRASSISGPSSVPTGSSVGGGAGPSSPTGGVPVSGDYLHLNIFPLPFTPDIYQTFLSLCDSLIHTYRHIERCLDNHLNLTHENYELLCKVDDKINKNFINPTVKEIDSLSRSLIYEETSKLGARLVRV
jgi:hypothetical protein